MPDFSEVYTVFYYQHHSTQNSAVMSKECSLENDAVPCSFPLNYIHCHSLSNFSLGSMRVSLHLAVSPFNRIALEQYHVSAIITYGFLELWSAAKRRN